MPTKDQFIELVKTRIAGGNTSSEQTAKFGSVITEYSIAGALNDVFYNIFRQDTSNLDLYSREYRNVDILYDAATNKYYSNLPENIVQLPDPQNGVRRISLMQDESVKFVPRIADAISVFNGLDVSLISDRIGYTVYAQRRVEYDNMNPAYTKVKMSLVIPFEKYDGDDDIYIPAGQEMNIVDMVIKLLSGQPNEKKLNDNSGKTV